MRSTTREQWLEKAVKLMTPFFKKQGFKVPKVRVACGWPSRGAMATAKGRTIGQCWSPAASTDKRAQIFISPYLVKPVDKFGVLPTLVHEVVHAVVGVENKHNAVFAQCARAVGLEGKLTHTVGGPALLKQCRAWMRRLKRYPHARLDSKKSPVKKQGTRLLKCECGKCGYTVRVTQKWIKVGAPLCPCNEQPMKVGGAK